MQQEPTIDATPESPAHLSGGQRVGRYEIVRLLGEGSHGAVYEATHTDLGKRVAIKVLHPAAAIDPAMRRRFLREGRAASRVHHPHVVDVTDVGVEGDRAYLVMEFLRGEDLATRIAREGALPLEGLVDLMLPVISAVRAAHEVGVLHRDLKPANVVLSTGPGGVARPVVVDFGISRIDDSDERLTHARSMLGSPSYMAPEQVTAGGTVDARADQYALGVVLYECATGVRPFQADSLMALIHEVGYATPRPPQALRPELPESFSALVMRAMHRNPAARYEDLRAFGAALLAHASSRARVMWEEEFAASASESRADVEPVATSPAPSRSGRERAVVVGGVAVVAAALFAAVFSFAGARARRGTRSPVAITTPRAAAPVTAPRAFAPTPPSTEQSSQAPAAMAPPPVPAPSSDASATPVGRGRAHEPARPRRRAVAGGPVSVSASGAAILPP